MAPAGDVLGEVAARKAVQLEHLRRLGLLSGDRPKAPPGVQELDDWWVHAPVLEAWQHQLRSAVQALQERDPLAPGLSMGQPATCFACPRRGCFPMSSAGLPWNRTQATSGCPAAGATLARSNRQSPSWSAGSPPMRSGAGIRGTGRTGPRHARAGCRRTHGSPAAAA